VLQRPAGGHGREAVRPVVVAFLCDRFPFRRQDAGSTLNRNKQDARWNRQAGKFARHRLRTDLPSDFIARSARSILRVPWVLLKRGWTFQRKDLARTTPTPPPCNCGNDGPPPEIAPPSANAGRDAGIPRPDCPVGFKWHAMYPHCPTPHIDGRVNPIPIGTDLSNEYALSRHCHIRQTPAYFRAPNPQSAIRLQRHTVIVTTRNTDPVGICAEPGRPAEQIRVAGSAMPLGSLRPRQFPQTHTDPVALDCRAMGAVPPSTSRGKGHPVRCPAPRGQAGWSERRCPDRVDRSRCAPRPQLYRYVSTRERARRRRRWRSSPCPSRFESGVLHVEAFRAEELKSAKGRCSSSPNWPVQLPPQPQSDPSRFSAIENNIATSKRRSNRYHCHADRSGFPFAGSEPQSPEHGSNPSCDKSLRPHVQVNRR